VFSFLWLLFIWFFVVGCPPPDFVFFPLFSVGVFFLYFCFFFGVLLMDDYLCVLVGCVFVFFSAVCVFFLCSVNIG